MGIRRPSDYIALALIKDRGSYDDAWALQSDFAGDPDEFHKHVNKICGFIVPDTIIAEVLERLSNLGVLKVTDDDYTGTYIKVSPNDYDDFIRKFRNQEEEIAKDDTIILEPSVLSKDFKEFWIVSEVDVLADYIELGNKWLERAIQGMKAKIDFGEDIFSTELENHIINEIVPASDRIVTINHNQQIEFEEATNEIIEKVEQENSIDGDNDLRSQILGQLKAGLEFIRAGIFKSQLLFLSLIDALQVLVLRYEKETVGALAAALIAELVKIL